MGTAIGIYGAGTGGAQDGLASVDVPQDGNLVGIEWSVRNLLIDADGEAFAAQVSFGSTGAFSTNDTRQVISQVCVGQADLVTSGYIVPSINQYTPLPNLRVAAGERLYLHTNASAGVSASIFCVCHFDFDLDRPLSRRR